MNGDESQKLDQIASDVSETKATMRVIDERTKHLSDEIDRLERGQRSNEADINNLEAKVKRNSTLFGGLATAGTAVLIWVSDKILKVFP